MEDPDNNAELPVAVIVSAADGTIVEMNGESRRLIGANGVGMPCWNMMGEVDGSKTLPCHDNCVCELVAAGSDEIRAKQIVLGGKRYQLSCVPTQGYAVTTITPLDQPPKVAGKVKLTPREVDVLRHLAGGLTTPEIATVVGISESTVRTHVEHMRHKLAVTTRAALVACVFTMGYLTADSIAAKSG